MKHKRLTAAGAGCRAGAGRVWRRKKQLRLRCRQPEHRRSSPEVPQTRRLPTAQKERITEQFTLEKTIRDESGQRTRS